MDRKHNTDLTINARTLRKNTKKEIIVFDKDGTLIDFDDFWVSVSISAVNEVLSIIGKEEINIEKILNAFGVENGVTDIDGILCKGTYEELGLALHDILKEYGCEQTAEKTVDMLTNAYKNNSDSGIVKPTCDNLKDALTHLKNQGRKLVIVTTDNYEITYKCLDKLGIKELFDAVFADDGTTPVKPDPSCILEYFKANGISADSAVMIGDTMTDVRFARNAGMNIIAVGKTEKNRQRLMSHADYVVDDVSYIHDIIEVYEK